MKYENSLVMPWWRRKEVMDLRDIWGGECLQDLVMGWIWGREEESIQDNSWIPSL